MIWFKLARRLHKDRNYSQALVAIKKHVEENPENKYGKLYQALIYRDLSNYDLSLKILNEIQPSGEDEKKYFELYYHELADTFNDKGDYNEAVKWYDKLIEIIPNRTKGYILKGACLAAAGKYEHAKAEHLKATKLEGDPEEAFYNLALISRAEMNFMDAKDYCEKSLEIDPKDEGVIHCYEDILNAIKFQKRLENGVN